MIVDFSIVADHCVECMWEINRLNSKTFVQMEDDEMEPLRSLPYQRYGHTVCAYRGRAYLWGGRNDDYGASSTLHEFDPGEALIRDSYFMLYKLIVWLKLI